jgi:hypothetical protein
MELTGRRRGFGERAGKRYGHAHSVSKGAKRIICIGKVEELA